MKFLYLKGIDIFGPFEAEQIKKEDCFSEELLVCPEDKAEQEAAWKPASCYPEFKNPSEREVFPIKDAKPIVSSTSIGVPPPISIPQKEEEVTRDLPPMEDTETDTSSTDLSAVGISFNEVMNELSTPENKTDEENGEEELEDHTFHIAHKEDNNLLEDLPAHRLIGAERESLIVQNGVVMERPVKSDNSNIQVNKDNNNADVKETDNVQGNKKELLEISNNKIISSSDGRVKKSKSNDLLFILSFLVLMVVAVALCMAFWNMMNENKEAQEEEKIEVTQPAEKISNNIAEEVHALAQETPEQKPALEPEKILNENVTPSKPAITEEQVIDIVKNTKLARKGQTIDAYLQSVYGSQYQYSWSAKPFTDNVYIVEFFASQVRSEPYVYLFRVDIDQKKITGALNNITLDLLA